MSETVERRPGLREVIAGETQICKLDEQISRVFIQERDAALALNPGVGYRAGQVHRHAQGPDWLAPRSRLETRYVNAEPILRPRGEYTGPQPREFMHSPTYGAPAN